MFKKEQTQQKTIIITEKKTRKAKNKQKNRTQHTCENKKQKQVSLRSLQEAALFSSRGRQFFDHDSARADPARSLDLS